MSAPPLDEIVRKIVDAFHPRRIVLFGSRARDEAGPDSDVDLMVEMESDASPPERAVAVSRLFRPRTWPMDLFVYTPDEARRFGRIGGTLMSTINAEGRVLYER